MGFCMTDKVIEEVEKMVVDLFGNTGGLRTGIGYQARSYVALLSY